jgi:aspartate kinase
VNVDAIRTLHFAAIDHFDLSELVRQEVTDLLDECQDMLNGVRLLQELSPKSLDQLVSYGERCSVRIMAARLNQIGVPAQAFDAWDIGIRTDSNFGDARIAEETEKNIRQIMGDLIDSSIVAIVTGFIGRDPEGRITTLGRGGSDLTATTIGAALDLDEIQVWKDVDGILTTDPRIVPAAVPVPDVSFEEASELAYFGAQVLHPIAMQPAMRKNIPVRVKNSYNPSHPGTVIQHREGQGHLVTAITCKRGVTVLDIVSTRMLGAYGFLSTVFSAFEKHKLSVDVLASSEVSVSLTLDKKQKITSTSEIMQDLSFCSEVSLKRNRAILTLISDVDRSSDVLATVFRVFSQQKIKVLMLSQGASKVNISFILREDQLDHAIRHLHSCFFEGQCIVDFEADNKAKEELYDVKIAVAQP